MVYPKLWRQNKWSLVFIKALKLLVVFVFEIQEYLDANDYVHTIYFESEIMAHNFNSATEFLWSYYEQRQKTDDPLSLPKSLFWTLFKSGNYSVDNTKLWPRIKLKG